MNNPDQQRIIHLEEQVMFLEKHLASVDEVTRTLHDRMDAVQAAVDRLRSELKTMRDDEASSGEERTLEDERPPHWG